MNTLEQVEEPTLVGTDVVQNFTHTRTLILGPSNRLSFFLVNFMFNMMDCSFWNANNERTYFAIQTLAHLGSEMCTARLKSPSGKILLTRKACRNKQYACCEWEKGDMRELLRRSGFCLTTGARRNS